MDTSFMIQLWEWAQASEGMRVTLRLVLSTIVGMIIGYERESHGQAAGFRTNTLVCVSSCLLMLLSLHLPQLYSHLSDDSVLRIDPGRIASYAVAGMGFLGAGAIIKGRGSVRGLTTAAGLWLVTALGLSIGAGMILPALLVTAISLPIMYYLRFFKSDIQRDEHTVLTVKCCCQTRPLREIKEILFHIENLEIQFINYHESREDGVVTYRFRLLCKQDAKWGEIVAKLLDIDAILEIAWDEADVP